MRYALPLLLLLAGCRHRHEEIKKPLYDWTDRPCLEGNGIICKHSEGLALI